MIHRTRTTIGKSHQSPRTNQYVRICSPARITQGFEAPPRMPVEFLADDNAPPRCIDVTLPDEGADALLSANEACASRQTIHHISNPADVRGRLRKYRGKRTSSTADGIANDASRIPTIVFKVEQTTATITLTASRMKHLGSRTIAPRCRQTRDPYPQVRSAPRRSGSAIRRRSTSNSQRPLAVELGEERCCRCSTRCRWYCPNRQRTPYCPAVAGLSKHDKQLRVIPSHSCTDLIRQTDRLNLRVEDNRCG